MIYVSISLIVLYLALSMRKPLHMLQQNWYNDDNRYLYWIFKNINKIFSLVELIPLLLFIILYKYNPFLFSYFYIILIIKEIKYKEVTKLPLVYTKRIKRLYYSTFVLLFVIVLLYKFNLINLFYILIIYQFIVIFKYFFLIIINYLNKPIENLVYKYYYNKANKKLKSLTNMDVIGITGSYGKTSSKNILFDVLSEKYNVFKTPKNYNTDYGMMLSINNHLDKFNDYFIAEMGAFKRGEINRLCNFVKPKYGILTKIGPAHLDTFLNIENIMKTKFELIESLPHDGIAVLNGDDEYQLKYNIKNNCSKIWIGIDNKNVDVWATNIKLGSNGTNFKCHFNNDPKSYLINIPLLGQANVYNVLASIALARELGMNMDQIISGISQIRQIEHRLELKYINGVTFIDDAYNSNPIGSKTAVEVLGLMPGKKIIVTPGMIELGKNQDELNKKFGMYIASNCDEVILIGKNQTKPIYDGLMESKFNKKNIYILNDVKEAFKLIGKLKDNDTYVLLENDLPDIFDEK